MQMEGNGEKEWNEEAARAGPREAEFLVTSYLHSDILATIIHRTSPHTRANSFQ
jgi:hypothetical protein